VQLDPNNGRALDGSVFDSATPDAVDPIDAPPSDASIVADATDAMDSSTQDASAPDVAMDSADAASDSADASLAPLCATTTCPAIASLSSGRDFSCARYANGRLACWGSNEHGQLGRGTVTAVAGDGSGGLFDPQWVSGLRGVVASGAGAMHACAASNSAGIR